MDRRDDGTEGAHPELSNPPGADSSKSGPEPSVGAAVRRGWGLGAGVGRGDGVGSAAPAGSGVAAGVAEAFVAAGPLVAASAADDAGALIGAGDAGAVVAVAGARSSRAQRTRSAGAGLRAKPLIGAASRIGCAGAAVRGALAVTAATTAKPSHRLTTAATMAPTSEPLGRRAVTASGTRRAWPARASGRGRCATEPTARG